MQLSQIGIYGLGTMGSALALNMAEEGFEVAVTNRETSWIVDFVREADELRGNLNPYVTLKEFIHGMQTPRVILFMIPSGAPLDSMIEKIVPLLDQGDTIIDGGNSDFNLTRRRSAELTAQGIHFVGMGVSGGEEGARHGPSIMVGGTEHSWTQLKPVVQAIAAKFEGDPCVDHLGPDGAGHFVKTVHNGIEYADMQMIVEVYGMMRAAGRAPAEMGAVFTGWNEGALKSYLVEITGKVLAATDPDSGAPMVDVILDKAGQKGTGRWTVIEALKLGQSASTIEAAVGARSWSSMKDLREIGEKALAAKAEAAPEVSDQQFEQALLAARIIAYAQGFTLLAAASEEYEWSLNLSRVAEIWRAGCIIRSALLDDISTAFQSPPPGANLILDDGFAAMLAENIRSLRDVVVAAAASGAPVPALAAALSYYDSMRHARGTANLIQGQRDFFGAHGFERVDRTGKGFHGPWGSGA